MSTATRVPETHQLEGDDALNALRRTGWGRLAKDSFLRFRAADGFSHSRALAFQITFTLLPAIIAVVGLATILHAAKFRDILRQTVTRLAPGPAGDIVVAAFKQGERTVGGGARAALLFGAVATLVSAATAMGQVERGANRIYGVEQDRPPLKKYGVGVLLACTTGLLMTLAFVLIVAGADIAKATKLSGVAWEVARWPLSILFLVIAVALLFKAVPKRRQPAASWLAVGSALSVLLWFAFTGLLALSWPEHDLRADLRPTGRDDRHPRLGAADLAGSLPRPGVRGPTRGGPGRRPRPRHRAADHQPRPGTSPAGGPPLSGRQPPERGSGRAGQLFNGGNDQSLPPTGPRLGLATDNGIGERAVQVALGFRVIVSTDGFVEAYGKLGGLDDEEVVEVGAPRSSRCCTSPAHLPPPGRLPAGPTRRQAGKQARLEEAKVAPKQTAKRTRTKLAGDPTCARVRPA
jgi:YihY family inner membrane protein